MFLLSFTNVSAPSRSFATLDEAVAAGRAAFFEFSVWNDGRRVASWTVFGGLRTF
jgi:hypothetical protein